MSIDPPNRQVGLPIPGEPSPQPSSPRRRATDRATAYRDSDADAAGPLIDLASAARIQLLVEQIQDFAIFMITPDGRHAT
jgi:hypothetical protein